MLQSSRQEEIKDNSHKLNSLNKDNSLLRKSLEDLMFKEDTDVDFLEVWESYQIVVCLFYSFSNWLKNRMFYVAYPKKTPQMRTYPCHIKKLNPRFIEILLKMLDIYSIDINQCCCFSYCCCTALLCSWEDFHSLDAHVCGHLLPLLRHHGLLQQRFHCPVLWFHPPSYRFRLQYLRPQNLLVEVKENQTSNSS